MLTATPRAQIAMLRDHIIGVSPSLAKKYTTSMKLNLHKQMTNQEIADVLEFISQVLKAQGANRFRAGAYENAAAAIKVYPKELRDMFLSDPDFDKVPGVGETLNQKLTELFTTGNIKALQQYVAEVPAGTYPLVQVHGIGGKKALKLALQFGLDNEETAIAQLLTIAKQGQIRDLPGFGEKSEADIIEQLERHTAGQQRMSYNSARQIADKLIEQLTPCPDITRIEALGSLRRHAATVGDVDLGIAVKDMGRVKIYVKNLSIVKNVVVAGGELMRVFLDDSTQVDIKVSTDDKWGAFLQHFTGSKEHNIRLREYALDRNMSLSEHGIKRLDPVTKQEIELLTFTSEEEFYYTLGLEWVPPEERVGGEEIKKYQIK